jgi:hypothetical protein
LQWLQDPSKINGYNLYNKIHEVSRHSGEKEREYLKDRINEHATNRTRIKDLCSGINEFTTLSKKYPTLGQEKEVAYLWRAQFLIPFKVGPL